MSTAIIILNWNGAADTIACLESLYKIPKKDFMLMVVDNGSTDRSIDEISDYFKKNNISFFRAEDQQEKFSYEKDWQPDEPVLLCLSRNYGFAKGNNLGIAFFEDLFAENPEQDKTVTHYLLLNNDTEVEPDFLEKLENFSIRNPEYAALTPQIRYMHPSDRIWNCGGKLFFGFRKYYYGEQSTACVPANKEFLNIGYITGCALFAKRCLLGYPDAQYTSVAEGRKRLLAERFFFGEEDFDFSLGLRKKRMKAGCVLCSIIYHKVGSSQKKDRRTVERTYIHYLNRAIDVRQHWNNPVKFLLWRCIYTPYMIRIFKRYGVSAKKAAKLVNKIFREARRLQGVDFEKFSKPF